VVSLYTADLLADGAYGHSVALQNANYCMAHGYTYSLFVGAQPRTAPRSNLLWLKPRAALLAAHRGDTECAWVWHLDGDAIVHAVSTAVEAHLSRFFERRPQIHVLMSTHEQLGGDSGDSQGCRCTRAGACTAGELRREWRHGNRSAGRKPIQCAPNSGVYVVRNGPTARSMLEYWAERGRGACSQGVQGQPEQKKKLRLIWQHASIVGCAQGLVVVFSGRSLRYGSSSLGATTPLVDTSRRERDLLPEPRERRSGRILHLPGTLCPVGGDELAPQETKHDLSD